MSNLNVRMTENMKSNLAKIKSLSDMDKTDIIEQLLFIGANLDNWEKKFNAEADKETDPYGRAIYKGLATTYTTLKKILMFKE